MSPKHLTSPGCSTNLESPSFTTSVLDLISITDPAGYFGSRGLRERRGSERREDRLDFVSAEVLRVKGVVGPYVNVVKGRVRWGVVSSERPRGEGSGGMRWERCEEGSSLAVSVCNTAGSG